MVGRDDNRPMVTAVAPTIPVLAASSIPTGGRGVAAAPGGCDGDDPGWAGRRAGRLLRRDYQLNSTHWGIAMLRGSLCWESNWPSPFVSSR